MSWDAFTAWRRDSSDIADATTHVTTLLMQAAPDGPDVFEYVATAAPVMLSGYAQASQDSALDYLLGVQRSAGLAPVLYRPAAATITAAALTPVVKWALTDVVFPYAVNDVLPRLAQGTTRLISNIGRETVQAGVGEIDGAVGRRVPGADACAWCRLQSAVTHWDGEWPDSSYHGHCRCEPLVMIEGRDGGVPDDLYDLWEDYEQQWLTADEWAHKEQRRIDAELWDRVKDTRYTFHTKKRMRGSLRRKELPTIQQLTLKRMREEYGAR